MKYSNYTFDNGLARAGVSLFDASEFQEDRLSHRASHRPSHRSEAHAVIHISNNRPFAAQVESARIAVRSLEEILNMKPVFKRWFLSDAANQAPLLPEDEPCAVSRIQQPPLDGSKTGLWVVFQENPDFVFVDDAVTQDSHGRIIMGDARASVHSDGNAVPDSRDITIERLSTLADLLEDRNASLLDNCVRTWFMVRDIDRNYRGVVVGRNEEFIRRGLTRDTHFIASTGIGGRPVGELDTVAFNAICDTALKPGQMNYLYGASHLNSTIEYGVAFERGTTVDYADRRHVYISGTASIDNNGRVLYPGDIKAQTRRMIENIGVLLNEAGCGFEDVAHLIVYLRDPADYDAVNGIYEEMMPQVPRILVLAPVCRPQWLVETECMAVKRASYPDFSDF